MREIIISPLVFIIKLYQMIISPIIGINCRFKPSCSNYALQSLKKYGLIIGCYYSARRILKCHPWGKSGHDPVP
tara:strand:+ start:742 stop:963 length:222 start_codon:yes stop_codon:yes gene_type:complete